MSSAQKKDLRQLEKLLKSHDWWYSYADDGASYRKGRDEQDQIKKLMNKVGGESPKQLYRKYARKAGTMESKTPESEWN